MAKIFILYPLKPKKQETLGVSEACWISYLTLPIVYIHCSPLMGRTLCNCIFLGIIALRHSSLSSANSFLMLRSMRSFMIRSPNQVADALWGDSQVSPDHLLFLAKHFYPFSRGGQIIYSTDLFKNTNYTVLFVEFLSSNTLFRSETKILANHTIVPYHCQQLLNDVLFR